MWLLLKNRAGDCLIDPINVSRTSNWLDFKQLDGLSANDCAIMLILIAKKFRHNDVFKMRLADAKHHAKLAFILKEKFWYRIGILFEAWDILLGQEDFWVPSLRNTVNLIYRLINTLEDNRSAIVEIM